MGPISDRESTIGNINKSSVYSTILYLDLYTTTVFVQASVRVYQCEKISF